MPCKNEKICVIPAHNEAANIYRVVAGLKSYFDRVVVVDDGSDDCTAAEASRAGALVLRHLVNRGQGAALETGNEYARRNRAGLVLHFDADGQFHPSDIEPALAVIDSGKADIVFGSRFLGKESNMPALKKYLIYPLARLVNRSLFGIKLSDPQNGFRALNARALSRIRIELDGFAHCTEIMHKAFQNDLKIKEMPVLVSYSRFGLGFFDGVRIFRDLMIAKIFY